MFQEEMLAYPLASYISKKKPKPYKFHGVRNGRAGRGRDMHMLQAPHKALSPMCLFFLKFIWTFLIFAEE